MAVGLATWPDRGQATAHTTGTPARHAHKVPSKASSAKALARKSSAAKPLKVKQSVQAKSSARKKRHPPEVAERSSTYAQRPEVISWARTWAPQAGLDPVWVEQQMAQAVRLPSVEKAVLPPSSPSAKNWAAYRARFIEPQRLAAGQQFWQTHREALERAEREYGVPPAIVVGILGVETLYGRHMGQYRILDALATLAFDFPSLHPRAAERQAYFRGELQQFLKLTAQSGSDPLSIRGSYAGAMGWPQFMPTSWARYAVDFDGDGKIDLFNSPVDAIGSVARYFQAFQWKPGLPTHYPVDLQASGPALEQLLLPDILPTFSAERMNELGAQLDASGRAHTGPLALVELRNGDQPPSYVVGTENFYAVTRYNWSSYYAMAVIELGQAVAQRLGR